MIKDIHLQNFRSYNDDSFELSPEVNIIVGPNASGKTNLLESILVISRGTSFRAKDIDMIEFEKDWLRIEANSDSFKRVVKIQKMGELKTSKNYEINTNKISRLNLSQTIPVVLFEPNHLLLLTGSPELRRNFLDDILEQSVAGFKVLKSHYKRALAQRNALLKNVGHTNNSQDLFVWNIRLSELGGKIFRERTELIKKLQAETTSIYDSLSGGSETIELSYATNINQNNYESNLLHELESTPDIDITRGFTGHGPHRDDLKLLINEKPAVEVASRGEVRSLLLTLKLVETSIVEKARDQKPLLLFDDVFSELDGARRMALTTILKGYQTIITTTDADVVVQHFMDSNNIIPLT